MTSIEDISKVYKKLNNKIIAELSTEDKLTFSYATVASKTYHFKYSVQLNKLFLFMRSKQDNCYVDFLVPVDV